MFERCKRCGNRDLEKVDEDSKFHKSGEVGVKRVKLKCTECGKEQIDKREKKI